MSPRHDADQVGQRYAAHRLELVRLAMLLLDEGAAAGAGTGATSPPRARRTTSTADAVVQAAFLRYLRRPGGHADPGTGLTDLRTLVVAGCRATRRRSGTRATRATRATPATGPTTGADVLDPLASLGPADREVLVLTAWAGLGVRQAAVVLRTSERAVAARVAHLAARPDSTHTRPTGPPADTPQTSPDRLAEALHRRADAVSAADLRGTWGDVLAEDARRSARARRSWRAAVAVVAAVAAVGSVATLAGGRDTGPAPTPVPTASPSPTAATEPLSSPALAPGEQPRSAIPWSDVGPGWAVVATSAPPSAVTTTLLLVSPAGVRYPLGTAPDSIVVQDVSPDGRRVLVAVGAQAAEWDLEAGTSRPLGVSYGWKTMRYAGDPERGYLVIWTDPGSSVQVDHWSPSGRLLAEYPLTLPPTAGSPGTPGVVVDPSGRQAVVATRDGGVASIDLGLDAVGALSLPAGYAGCSPRTSWSPAQVLVACTSGSGRLLVAPLDGSAAQPLGGDGLAAAWLVSAQAALVQQDDSCSTRIGTLNGGGALTPWIPPPGTEGLVPNTVVAGVLYLGGTRCPSDGARFVAYDLASGRATELTGADAGGRTVRQAVVLQPHH